MSKGRAQRWLDWIWAASDLRLVPYERPCLVVKAPVPVPEERMKARLDALLSIPPARHKKRPLEIDVQGREHTRGVAVVNNLYKLGRSPNPKREQRVKTAELHLEVGKDGVDHKELSVLKKAQAFSVDRSRPLLIEAAVAS